MSFPVIDICEILLNITIDGCWSITRENKWSNWPTTESNIYIVILIYICANVNKYTQINIIERVKWGKKHSCSNNS